MQVHAISVEKSYITQQMQLPYLYLHTQSFSQFTAQWVFIIYLAIKNQAATFYRRCLISGDYGPV
jgi:hypothetical protein